MQKTDKSVINKEGRMVKDYIPAKGDFVNVTFSPQSGHEEKAAFL